MLHEGRIQALKTYLRFVLSPASPAATGFAILLLFLAAACAVPQARLDAPIEQGMGRVIMSMTYSRKPGSIPVQEMQYTITGSDGRKMVVAFQNRQVLGNPSDRIGIEEHGPIETVGQLVVAELREDTYTISGWNARARGTLYVDDVPPEVAPAPVQFVARAGRTIYAGNYNVWFVGQRRGAEIKDMRVRDVELAEKRYPGLGTAIEYLIMH